MVQVHCNERLATHIGPEPCVCIREDAGEASAGERIGQPLSRERTPNPDADAVPKAEGHARARHRKCVPDRAWSETLACTEAPCAGTGRSPNWPGQQDRPGPHWEGEEPKPMKHGSEKSDARVVAAKSANKFGQPEAESMEPRRATKENTDQTPESRTQCREIKVSGLERVRQRSKSHARRH